MSSLPCARTFLLIVTYARMHALAVVVFFALCILKHHLCRLCLPFVLHFLFVATHPPMPAHARAHMHTHTESFMHDCFAIELTGECLKCFIRLTRDVPAVVVQSEALWARIPEIQVRIPSRAMGTFFPHTVSSIFRLSLTHKHTHTHTRARTHARTHTYDVQCLVGSHGI